MAKDIGGTVMLASESVALEGTGFTPERDVAARDLGHDEVTRCHNDAVGQ